MSGTRRIALIGIGLALALTAFAAAGCGPSKADVAAQQKQECAANQRRIRLATDLVNSDTGFYPDIATVVDKLQAVCPNGGAYSFDPGTDKVSCSVHGPL